MDLKPIYKSAMKIVKKMGGKMTKDEVEVLKARLSVKHGLKAKIAKEVIENIITAKYLEIVPSAPAKEEKTE